MRRDGRDGVARALLYFFFAVLTTRASALFTVTCTLRAVARDVNVGNATAHGTLTNVCITSARMYVLARDNATVLALDAFEWGQEVQLALESTGTYRAGEVVYRVLHGAAMSAAGLDHHVAAALENAGRFIAGERRIRLLSVMVEINGAVAEYAGATRQAREAWAHEQRRYMGGACIRLARLRPTAARRAARSARGRATTARSSTTSRSRSSARFAARSARRSRRRPRARPPSERRRVAAARPSGARAAQVARRRLTAREL